jgi:hypothetical protein
VSAHETYDPDDSDEHDRERSSEASMTVEEVAVEKVAKEDELEGDTHDDGDSVPRVDSFSRSNGYGSSVEVTDDYDDVSGDGDGTEVDGPRVVVGTMILALCSLCEGSDADRMRLLFSSYAANPRANAAASSSQALFSQTDMVVMVASLLASPAHRCFPVLKAIVDGAGAAGAAASTARENAVAASQPRVRPESHRRSESDKLAIDLAMRVSDAASRRQTAGVGYHEGGESSAQANHAARAGVGVGNIENSGSESESGDDREDEDEVEVASDAEVEGAKIDAYDAALQYVGRMSAFQHGRRGKGLTRASWSSCVLADPLLHCCLASSVSPGGVTASINMGGAQQPRHHSACGYLWKRGSLSRIWKRRWVVLEVGKYSLPLLAAFRSHYTQQLPSDMLSRLPLYEHGLRIELVGAAATEAACVGAETDSPTLGNDKALNGDAGAASRGPTFSFSGSGGVATAIAASKAAAAAADAGATAGAATDSAGIAGAGTTSPAEWQPLSKADSEDVGPGRRMSLTSSTASAAASSSSAQAAASSPHRMLYEFHVKVVLPHEDRETPGPPSQQAQQAQQEQQSQHSSPQQAQQPPSLVQGEEKGKGKDGDGKPVGRSRASSISASAPAPTTMVWEFRAHSTQELEHWLRAIDPRYSCRFNHTALHFGL